MSKEWPRQIRNVLVKYWKETEGNKHSFTPDEKKRLVAELIEAYNMLSDDDRADTLIPASGSFLKEQAVSFHFPAIASLLPAEERLDLAEIAIRYDWDTEHTVDGFVPGTDVPSEIRKGKQYDRIGRDSGRFLCPIRENGEPEDYLARSIPYYIPNESDVSSSPAYHLYQANRDFNEGNGYPKCGTIARMFRKEPDDGGGKQIVLSEGMQVCDLLRPLNEGDAECVLTCLK